MSTLALSQANSEMIFFEAANYVNTLEKMKTDQEAIYKNVQTECETLNSQGWLAFALGALQIIAITGYLVGASLKGPADADGVVNFVDAAAPPPSWFNRIAEFGKQALIATHEKMPDYANAVGKTSELFDKRFEGKKNLINAKIRQEEMNLQEKQRIIAKQEKTAEERRNAFLEISRSLTAAASSRN